MAGILGQYNNIQLSNEERLKILVDIKQLKQCMINDFKNDDKTDIADIIYQTPSLAIYNKKFRKTLQPISIIEVTFRS